LVQLVLAPTIMSRLLSRTWAEEVSLVIASSSQPGRSGGSGSG